MPHRELNDRFKAHIARAQRVRRIVAGSIAVVCLLIGTGLAFEIVSPPNSIARATLTSTIASVREKIADALNTNIPHAQDQLAAAASSGWFKNFADALYRTVCPIFRSCPADVLVANPPQKTQPQPTAKSADVKLAQQFPSPAPSTGGAATSVAVSKNNLSSNQPPVSNSNPAAKPATVINQPVIERIRETVRVVTEGGTNAAYVDERMAALAASLQSQIASVAAASHSESQTIYQTVGMVGRVENLSGTHLTDITVDGVSGLTDADIPDGISVSNYLPLTGGSLSGDLALSGTLTAGSLSVAGVSSSGALIGPYVTATSTTATSTFAGGLFSNYGAFNSASFGATATSSFNSAGVLSLSSPLAISSGGTATTTFYNGGIVFADGTKLTQSAAAANIFWDETNKRLGIGTAGPGSKLSVSGGGTFGASYEATAAPTNGLLVEGNVGVGLSNPTAHLHIRDNGASDANAELLSLQSLYGVSGQKALTWRDGTNITGQIDTRYDGTGVNMVFGHLYNSGYQTSDLLTLKANGNVGIGTTSPGQKLSVAGDILGNNIIGSYFTATSTTATSTFAGGITGPNNFTVQSSSGKVGVGTLTTLYPLVVRTTTHSNIAIATPATLGSGAEILSMTDNGAGLAGMELRGTLFDFTGGNVGIANSAPSYALDVTGLGHFTGLVDAANFVATSTTATSTLAGGITGPNNFVVQSSSGRVGIGTASPADTLHISGTGAVLDAGAFSTFVLRGYDAADNRAILLRGSGNAGRGSQIIVSGNGNSTYGASLFADYGDLPAGATGSFQVRSQASASQRHD